MSILHYTRFTKIENKIYQVVFPVNTSSIINTIDGMKIIKESRFSYIRSIDGVTRLKLYNCLYITGLENVVDKGGQVVIEIPNGCLILFTGDNFHGGVSTFHKAERSNPSDLRLFSYIVEKEYLTGNEDITSIQQNTICQYHCNICKNMQQQNIHYPGHLVQYSLNKSGIENLIAGTVMLGGLEEVGRVVLKAGYNIQPFCDLENTLYDLNNQYPKQKNE